MRTVHTACTYDCPDACAQRVTVDDAGRLSIRGSPDHPITRGFVCQRVRRQARRLVDPDRLREPLVREGGGFKPIEWDRALDLAAARLGEALRTEGAGSVVFVQGGGSLGLKKELVGHFFRSLGPVTTLRGGVCGDCGEEAQRQDFGDAQAHDYTDMAHSQAVVVWGRDPAVTSVHMVPFLQDARRRGAEVVVIDLQRTRSTRFASRFIRVAPGGDGALALAVIRRLADQGRLDPGGVGRCENLDAFERMLAGPGMDVETLARRADVTRADVDWLAELFASRRPVGVHLGWGMQRRRAGGAVIRCIDALGVLTGNVGIPGGGVSFTSWRRRGLDRSMLARATGRTLPMPTFGRELAALSDPPARFVFVCGANPACQLADSGEVERALRASGFVVVADAFMTDTAACADLVLPVTLMYEEAFDAVGSFLHHHVARVRQVVEPPEGVREDLWIARELARRLGRPDDPLLDDPRAALERMIAPWGLAPGQDFGRNPFSDPVPFARRFETPSGKMRLLAEVPPDPPPATSGYPLLLLSPKPARVEHSQVHPDEQTAPMDCWVNPRAPGAEGLREGDLVQLVSPRGALPVVVRLDDSLHPGVCRVEVGGWLRLGRAINLLVEGQATDLGENTAFYDQRVGIERLPEGRPSEEPCAR